MTIDTIPVKHSKIAIMISHDAPYSTRYLEKIEKTLISQHEIASRIKVLGQLITADFLVWEQNWLKHQPSDTQDVENSEICPSIEIITLLTGSLLFTADLVRHLSLPLHIHPLKIRSYEADGKSAEGAKWELGVGSLPKFQNHHYILIVDDILDSGETMTMVVDKLHQSQLESSSSLHLKTCVLLDKLLDPPPASRIKFPSAEFTGFQIPDEFVVGYGLDFNGQYRNLPDIVTLKTNKD